VRSPRQAWRQGGRALQERGRRGEPPSRLRPAGGVLKLGGNLLVGPAAACARCQARRSGSARRSMASASAWCAARRFSGDAARYAAERTSGCRKVTRAPIVSNPSAPAGTAASIPIPSRPAARHISTGSPVGSAAATSNSRRVVSGNRSLSLSDSGYRSAGGRERSSAVWSGGHPRRPVAVFRHRAVAAAKPSGNPPSLARVGRGGAQGVALTPRSVRSRRCHTCPSAHLRVFHAQHQSITRTQYRVRKLTIQ